MSCNKHSRLDIEERCERFHGVALNEVRLAFWTFAHTMQNCHDPPQDTTSSLPGNLKKYLAWTFATGQDFVRGEGGGTGKEDVPGKCGPQPQSSANSSRRHPSVNLKDDLSRLYNRSLYRLIVIAVKLPVYCGVAELRYVTLRNVGLTSSNRTLRMRDLPSELSWALLSCVCCVVLDVSVGCTAVLHRVCGEFGRDWAVILLISVWLAHLVFSNVWNTRQLFRHLDHNGDHAGVGARQAEVVVQVSAVD